MIRLDFTTERALLQVVANGRAARARVFVFDRATDVLVGRHALNPANANECARFVAALREDYRPGLSERLADAAVELARRETAAADTDEDTGQGRALDLQDPDAWPQPVNGAELLERVAGWVRRYVWLPEPAADAVALWIAATWYVESTYYAALLVIVSATRRCGKSLLLDLTRRVVRRGLLASGHGVTPAVLFRLNESHRPTFCIDEAEKLNGRDADRDLIGLLNAGYRRGASAARCSPDDHEVRLFDAFGFRALAAIGALWGTIMDRAVVLRLARKPRDVTLDRFNSRAADDEGQDLAAQLRRWAQDCGAAVLDAEHAAPRPGWLHDRACDNWAALFAVADVAGGAWPGRAEHAARALQLAEDEEQDPAERLVHDLRRVFDAERSPDVIQSGDLATKLKALEDAPWSDYRSGQGLSTHGLARLLRGFGVRPESRRGADGVQTRGYWLADLVPLFERYPGNSSETVHDLETVPF